MCYFDREDGNDGPSVYWVNRRVSETMDFDRLKYERRPYRDKSVFRFQMLTWETRLYFRSEKPR